MAPRLNGWQRLWVVFAALYLMTIIGFTLVAFPKREDIESSRVYDSISAIGKYRETSETGFSLEGAYSVRTMYFRTRRSSIVSTKNGATRSIFPRLRLNYIL
jgi:hypothetical protein